MSISETFRKSRSRHTHRLRRRLAKELIGKAARLGPNLRPKEQAEEELEEAKKHSGELERPGYWNAWKALIEVHRTCDRQVRAFNRARNLLRKAKELEPEDRTSLLKPLQHLLQDTTDRHLVKQELREAQERWGSARAEIEEDIPDAFLIHSFLRVAERSRVEVVALFLGLIIFMGAVFTEAFYHAAIGSSVLRYVTLEDFLDEGVRGVYLFATFLIVAELVFWVVRWSQRGHSHRWRYRPHRWILDRPFPVAAGWAILVLAGTFVWGWALGEDRRAEFFAMKPRSVEMATVMDGTVLRDVYLVGTTSRTATFLQVCKWDDSPSGEDGRVLDACTRETSASAPEGDSSVDGGRVLVLDRALVVCHAAGEACTNQKRRDLLGSNDDWNADVARELEGVARSGELLGQEARLKERLEEKFSAVDKHLNRHRRQIVERIDGLTQVVQ